MSPRDVRHGPAPSGDDELPFDPLTVLLGAWRRRRIVFAAGVFSVFFGIVAGYGLGTRVFEATTVLIAPARDPHTGEDAVDLTTEMNLVKIPSSLEEVRRRLHLAVSISTLGHAISVNRQGKTNLLILSARWPSAPVASSIANTMRDVYLERQVMRSQGESRDRVNGLLGRIADLRAELSDADDRLEAFATENRIVDLDKESQWYMEELSTIDLMYEEARSRVQTNRLQRENIGDIITKLQEQVRGESDRASLEGLGTLNIRIERLRDAIHDDEQRRAMEAELAQRELELEQARQLFERKVLTESEYERARNAYDRQLAYTRDTDQTAAWRSDLAELQDRMLPGGSAILLRSFEIEIEAVTLDARVEHLAGALAKMQARLDAIPLLERSYMALLREVTLREKILQKLGSDLADARTTLESNGPALRVVSEASVPLFPHQSNRRLLFLAVVVTGLGGALAVVVLAEVVDTSLKSEADAQRRLGIRVLGTLPRFRAGTILWPGPEGGLLAEPLRRVGHWVKAAVPGDAARILVVATGPNEGTSTIAANLAATLGRNGERVLLLESRADQPADAAWVELLEEGDEPLQRALSPVIGGARAALMTASTRLVSTLERVLPTVAGAVAPLVRRARVLLSRHAHRPNTPASSAPPDETEPNSYAKQRVRDASEVEKALGETATRFATVVIDAPPARTCADALAIARWVDAVVLVVRSHGPSVASVRRTIEEFEAMETPVVGLVLNHVDRIYRGRAA